MTFPTSCVVASAGSVHMRCYASKLIKIIGAGAWIINSKIGQFNAALQTLRNMLIKLLVIVWQLMSQPAAGQRNNLRNSWRERLNKF